MEANVARKIHISNVTVLGTGNLGSQIAYQTARGVARLPGPRSVGDRF